MNRVGREKKIGIPDYFPLILPRKSAKRGFVERAAFGDDIAPRDQMAGRAAGTARSRRQSRTTIPPRNRRPTDRWPDGASCLPSQNDARPRRHSAAAARRAISVLVDCDRECRVARVPPSATFRELHALANGEDRQPAIERVFGRQRIPICRATNRAFPRSTDRAPAGAGILGNVAAASEEECVHLVERHRVAGGVLDLDLGMGRQDWIEPLFIAASNPAGKIRHRRTCDCWREV